MLHLTKPKIAAIWITIVLAGVAAGWHGARRARAHFLADLVDDARRCAAAFDPDSLHALNGTRNDVTGAAYAAVKRRLIRLQAVDRRLRDVRLYRFVPETGRVVLLADSTGPGAQPEAWPGDSDPQAEHSPGLQEVIRTGLPSAEEPRRDDSGTWATGYALIDEVPSAKAGVPLKQIVGLELDAADWSRTLWAAAFPWALSVWVLLGLPFAAWRVVRRQLDQREAIRNLSEAMEQSHSALMIVDLESRIEYVNRGLCRQSGYMRREMLGRNWRDFQAAETPPERLAELTSSVRAGQPWEGELFSRRKDGTLYPVRGVVTPVRKRDGTLACYIAVLDDMTGIKRTEAELREARDLAQAGDRAKGQFLATMSHEVRTPLNGIIGFTNLLLGTALTAEQRDYVETIRTGGEALLALTGDILDFARIESGKLQLEPVACDPCECVEEALDLLATRAAEKNLELLHWAGDDVPTAVLADGSRLRQVLVNLVNNAVKFTLAGEVEVRVRLVAPVANPAPAGPLPAGSPLPPAVGAETCVLEFSVRDTGIGITPEQHDKLFKPFSQVDASNTRKYGGTGLGLAICKNLVQLMGGQISVVSEPGRGSTFSFTISAAVIAPTAPPADLRGLRLALVAPAGPLRRELARLAARWRAPVIEADEPAALQEAQWDTALVVVDEPLACRLAAQSAPARELPPARTLALVPVALSRELRAALHAHFRLLLNKPVHHAALLAQLSGISTAPVLTTPPPTHFGFRVLLVEDNPVNQRLMQRVLVTLGCQATVVDNGRRAIEALARDDAGYDVVLMDLHMPEMDGVTAIDAIRAGKAGLRAQGLWIAALTADVRDSQKARTLTAGANDYLTKPLKLPELEAALRRYRETRQAASK